MPFSEPARTGLGGERRLGSAPRHDERRRGSIPHNGGGFGGEKTMKIPPPFDLARVRYCLSSFLSIQFESELFLSSIFLILFFPNRDLLARSRHLIPLLDILDQLAVDQVGVLTDS